MRPIIPSNYVGHVNELTGWAHILSLGFGRDVKHTERWACYVCGAYSYSRRIWPLSEPLEGKPARETQFDVMSWLHLPQPKLNIYVSWHVEFIHLYKLDATCTFQVHHICEAGGGPCHEQIKAQTMMMRIQSGAPGSRTPHLPMPPGVTSFPLAGSCANCQRDERAEQQHRLLPVPYKARHRRKQDDLPGMLR